MMKKYIFLLAFVLFAGTPIALAQDAAGDASAPADSTSQSDAAPDTAVAPSTDTNTTAPVFSGAKAPASNQTNQSQTSGFVPLAPIPGLTDQQPTQGGLAVFFNNLYKYLIGLAAALAVLQITWAGINIAYFHKDAVAAITDDKGKIYNAVIGLVLVLAPVLVFSIINPSILNLSFNIPALDTQSGKTVQTSQTPQPLGTVATSSLNAVHVGQLVGFGDNYYPDTTVGAYCFPITPIARNGKQVKYGCSADPSRCLTFSNGSNGNAGAPKSLLPPGTQCTKY